MSVYFVTCRDANAVKIGHSGDPYIRMREIQWGCPLPLKLEAVIPGKVEDEKTFHARFDDDRIHGEWFRLTEMIEAIIAANPVTDRPKINPSYHAPKTNRTLVAEVRAQLGVTHAAMARMVGLPTPWLRKYERGKFEGFKQLPEELERKIRGLVAEIEEQLA